MLGLSGQDPEYIPVQDIDRIVKQIQTTTQLLLNNEFSLSFSPDTDIIFHKNFLPFHANGIRFTAQFTNGQSHESTYYSIGGGFIVQEEVLNRSNKLELSCAFPYQVQNANELLSFAQSEQKYFANCVYQRNLHATRNGGE